MDNKPQELILRAWSKVEVRGLDECWPFQGALNRGGYGRFCSGPNYGLPANMPRLILYLTRGVEVLRGITRHVCDNPLCCNPTHLIPGSSQDNIRDRDTRGRQSRGELRYSHKLTEQEVLDIRGDGREHQVIAQDYPVTPSTISKIKRKELWRYL